MRQRIKLAHGVNVGRLDRAIMRPTFEKRVGCPGRDVDDCPATLFAHDRVGGAQSMIDTFHFHIDDGALGLRVVFRDAGDGVDQLRLVCQDINAAKGNLRMVHQV